MALGSIIEAGDAVRRIGLSNNRLYFEFEGQRREHVTLDELLVLIVDGSHTVLTKKVLSALAVNNCMLLVTDDRHIPSGYLIPVSGYVYQAKRLREQIDVPDHRKRKAWAQIVRAKIIAQRRTLAYAGRDHSVLFNFESKVKNGDSSNIEAQAAKRYWKELFAIGKFQRSDDTDGRNALLNYGYSLLRASLARAVCGAGLNPSLGVYHSNRSNAFSLCDDFIEPFRPMVDLLVSKEDRLEADNVLTRERKAALLSLLFSQLYNEGVTHEFSSGIKLLVNSYVKFINREIEVFQIPKIFPDD